MDASSIVVSPEAAQVVDSSEDCPFVSLGFLSKAVEVDKELVFGELEPFTMPIGGEACPFGPPQALAHTHAAPIVLHEVKCACVHSVRRVAE